MYLGTRWLLAWRGDEWLCARPLAPGADGAAALTEWLGEGAARQRLRVWLSGGLCRPFITPGVAGLSGEAEWRQAAAAMAPAQTGLQGPCAVWLGPKPPPGAGRLIVVLEHGLLERLQAAVGQTAGRGGHRLVSVAPWWSRALGLALRRGAAPVVVAVQDCDALTVLSGNRGLFEAATALSPVTDSRAADAALSRLLLTVDAKAQPPLCVRLRAADAQAKPRGGIDALTEWSL